MHIELESNTSTIGVNYQANNNMNSRKIPLNKLGAIPTTNSKKVHFGLYLPWVSNDVNNVYVKIIHSKDQFIPEIEPMRFKLNYKKDSDYVYEFGEMDYWHLDLDIGSIVDSQDGSNWGDNGQYLYRYEIESVLLNDGSLDWIVDPFAREYGHGKQSAFTIGSKNIHTWSSNDTNWKTPHIHDLIVYEIHLHEFAHEIKNNIKQIPYLKDLGVNCIEIMPVSNVQKTSDWGFEAIAHYGIDERYGSIEDMKELVDVAHQNGIAVILDVLYGHTGTQFAYNYIYEALNYNENPFIGNFGDMDAFGASVDFNREYVRDYFFTVNTYILETFHIDGFRYDCVPNYYDGYYPSNGYSNLVYQTYQHVKNQRGNNLYSRFINNNKINIIQCAEQLEKPKEIINHTYSNSTWQNGTIAAFKGVVNDYGRITDLGHNLGSDGYDRRTVNNGDEIDKAVFQYYENHDHSRFICNFGEKAILWSDDRPAYFEGDRSKWYKIQPYAISLLLSKGIPLLWEGQEILENYFVPGDGKMRIGVQRPVRWEYFYSEAGNKITSLYRKVLNLRKNYEVFRRGSYFFYNKWEQWQSKGILLYSRIMNNRFALVAANFSDQDQQVDFWFPISGNYTELLYGEDSLLNVEEYKPYKITIPSNYGKVWINN